MDVDLGAVACFSQAACAFSSFSTWAAASVAGKHFLNSGSMGAGVQKARFHHLQVLKLLVELMVQVTQVA